MFFKVFINVKMAFFNTGLFLFELVSSLKFIYRGIKKIDHQIDTVKNDQRIASAWDSKPNKPG